VCGFGSGEEALAALWDAPVELLLVDMLLPRMSGIELVRELRARPWAQATPVLAVTGLLWSAEQILTIEDSMAPAQLLRKPVEAEDLLSVVRAMVARASRRSGIRPSLVGAGSPPQPLEALVLAGMDDLVPHVAAGFLLRGDLRVVRTPSLGAALAIAERHRGRAALVVNGELLRGDPAVVERLRRANAAFAAVVAGPELAKHLPPDLLVVEASLAPRRMLDAICRRASLAQRASARVDVKAPVRIAREDGPVSGTVEDVSLGGLRMVTGAPCAVGDRLEVELELPAGAGRVKGCAAAVRVCTLGPEAREVSVAATFERLDGDSADLLRRFLAARTGAEAYRRYLGAPPRPVSPPAAA